MHYNYTNLVIDATKSGQNYMSSMVYRLSEPENSARAWLNSTNWFTAALPTRASTTNSTSMIGLVEIDQLSNDSKFERFKFIKESKYGGVRYGSYFQLNVNFKRFMYHKGTLAVTMNSFGIIGFRYRQSVFWPDMDTRVTNETRSIRLWKWVPICGRTVYLNIILLNSILKNHLKNQYTISYCMQVCQHQIPIHQSHNRTHRVTVAAVHY